MATTATVSRFYGTDLARPFLLPSSDYAGSTKMTITTFSNPTSRVARPLSACSALLQWAENAIWKNGGVAKTRPGKAMSSTPLITLGQSSRLSGKPKRPASAYFLFATEERAVVAKEMPELAKSVTLMAKEIARRWKEIDPERKEALVADADKLKEEWKIELAAWKEENEPGKRSKRGSSSGIVKEKGKRAKRKSKKRKSKKTKKIPLTPGAKVVARLSREEMSTPPAMPATKVKTPNAPKKRKVEKKARQSRRTLRLKKKLN